jgi:hypothetical protein
MAIENLKKVHDIYIYIYIYIALLILNISFWLFVYSQRKTGLGSNQQQH